MSGQTERQTIMREQLAAAQSGAGIHELLLLDGQWRRTPQWDLASRAEYHAREAKACSQDPEQALMADWHQQMWSGADGELARRERIGQTAGRAPSTLTAEYIQQVRAAATCHEYLGSKGLPLRRSGADRYVCACPFHSDHTPSFTVFEDDRGGHFYCFSCSCAGDVFEWEMVKGASFVEAVRLVAEYGGIALPGHGPDPIAW